MGADNIAFTIKSKATRIEIQSKFETQRQLDKDENGHSSGYSGDFQTVDRVEFHLDKVFETRNEAEDYCLDNAEKWVSVVAVYYKNKQGETNTLIAGWGAC